jgi:predicted Zn-dependent protease
MQSNLTKECAMVALNLIRCLIIRPGVIATYHWEFNLVQDDETVNAWVMPGGKAAVYKGILKYTQDGTGLAVVLGHEAGFWQRMQAQEQSRPPEFLSTHPAPETRIRDIRAHLAEARSYYQKSSP